MPHPTLKHCQYNAEQNTTQGDMDYLNELPPRRYVRFKRKRI